MENHLYIKRGRELKGVGGRFSFFLKVINKANYTYYLPLYPLPLKNIKIQKNNTIPSHYIYILYIYIYSLRFTKYIYEYRTTFLREGGVGG